MSVVRKKPAHEEHWSQRFHRYPMPVNIHETLAPFERVEISAGMCFQVQFRPQLVCRPYGIRATDESRESFILREYRHGNESFSLAYSAGASLKLWTPDLLTTLQCEDRSKWVWRGNLDVPAVQPGIVITAEFTNMTNQTRVLDVALEMKVAR